MLLRPSVAKESLDSVERPDQINRREGMGGANLKAETMALMDKRAAMETEMNSFVERLCNPGGPGLSGNLVDSEVTPTSICLSSLPPSFLLILYDIDRGSLGKISTFRRLELSAVVLLVSFSSLCCPKLGFV